MIIIIRGDDAEAYGLGARSQKGSGQPVLITLSPNHYYIRIYIYIYIYIDIALSSQW